MALPRQKNRYEILDGLRGVAALVVLAYHLCDLHSTGNPADSHVNHGYLAVDFFFILSGYVIGYAYDDRWDRMNLTDFFKRRLIRLHPMIIISTVIGVLLFYTGAGDMFPLIADTSAVMLLFCSVLSVLMIPAPVSIDIRGWSEINAINGNAWTLYYEYFANIIYALFIRRLSKIGLSVFVGLSAILTLNLALDWDLFGTFANREAQRFTMIGGWVMDAEHIMISFSRLLFPFFAGLLLSRLNWKINIAKGFWVTSAFLFAILMMPRIGGNEHGIYNGIYEAVAVILFFPLIVSMGAGSIVAGKSAAICKWLGEISYPLYIIHYPIVYTCFGAWSAKHPDLETWKIVLLSCGVFVFSVILAHAILKLYDIPVREFLQNRYLKKRPRQEATVVEASSSL